MDIVREFAWEHDVTMHVLDLSLPLLELVCKLSHVHLHLGHRPGYRLSWPHLWLNIYLERRAFLCFTGVGGVWSSTADLRNSHFVAVSLGSSVKSRPNPRQ